MEIELISLSRPIWILFWSTDQLL